MAIAPRRSSAGAVSPSALEINVRAPAANAAAEKKAVLTTREGRKAPKSAVITASAIASATTSCSGSRSTKRRRARFPATYAPAPVARSAPVRSVDASYDSTKSAPE